MSATQTGLSRIEVTPGVCGAKPHISGHRVRVQDVVVWYERLGQTPDEIVSAHPTLTLADVHAALAYYYDHMGEVNEDIRVSRATVEAMKSETPSKLHS